MIGNTLTINSSVSDLPFVGPGYEKKLEKLGISTIKNMLLHVPHRYLDYSNISKINSLKIGEIVTVKGVVNSVRNQFTKSGKRMQIGTIEDETGKVTVLWFNQPYLIRALYPGCIVSISGKVDWFLKKPAFISPEFEIIKKDLTTTHTGKISGIYPETAGISSKWIRSKIKFAISKIDLKKYEYLPKQVIKKYNLLRFDKAIYSVHFPKNEKEYKNAKKRLAFDELLLLQKTSLENKSERMSKINSIKKQKIEINISEFIKNLPFELTNSQKRVVSDIKNDFSRAYPANRLLQGDVGSGKTVVGACAIYISYVLGGKSVLMAPTQILALQHFNVLKQYLKKFKIKIDLVTASNRKINKNTDVYVGTHTLINQSEKLNRLGLVIIDEQHKFGVKQREILENRDECPHILTMTATPIPRTVAMTLYGDLEMSILDESPKNRKKITTWIIPETKRKGAYQWINQQLTTNNSQLYWVCPLINESESETLKDIKSVKTEYAKLKLVFPNLYIDLLHGRIKQDDKKKVLERFQEGKTDILVSTPVVEVGIDVANATIMVIEGAERFGLAQLHQLRGRVGRGEKKSYCLLFSDKESPRLDALTKTHSGFELAELDLKLRGPGEIFGTRQSGIPELRIANWTDTTLIKQTREAAQLLIEN